ncbi:MAG: DUF4038 domain-containing protein, partial [Bacteroidota bacterium]
MRWTIIFLLVPLVAYGNSPVAVEVNTVHEITLTATEALANPYTNVTVLARFTNEAGAVIRRPAFWDGGRTWKIRFTASEAEQTWTYVTAATPATDPGLHGQTGQLLITAGRARNDLLTVSPGRRNLVRQDGRPFLLTADTPWAMPFRATHEQVHLYAEKRRRQGFNAALLMVLQPDTKAEGPDARNTDQGFRRGFRDLADGHLNELDPAYFQYLDSMVHTLRENRIVPVYQPLFHGFGWKGLDVLGNTVIPEEYVRFCRYLLARYGASPAIWLIAADNGGRDPGVREAGEMLEAEDAYGQPTGLHYSPCDDYLADWAKNNPLKHCEHYNKTFQTATWLDFQWAQSGHNGQHDYTKVAAMYDNLPVKAVANGEPTYEGMNAGKNGLGSWQGEEAWGQFFSGGTMGVVYGAASLWQWKVSPDEAGWTAWSSNDLSWREALFQPGADYVGRLARTLSPYDLTDLTKLPPNAGQSFPHLVRPGEIYLAYLPQGGQASFAEVPTELTAIWASTVHGQKLLARPDAQETYVAPNREGWVLIIARHSPAYLRSLLPYPLPDPTEISREDWEDDLRPRVIDYYRNEVYGFEGAAEILLPRQTLREAPTPVFGGLGFRTQVSLTLQSLGQERQVDLLIYYPAYARQEEVPTLLNLNFLGNQSVTEEPEVFFSRNEIYTSRATERGIVNRRPTEKSRGTRSHRLPVEYLLRQKILVAGCDHGVALP